MKGVLRTTNQGIVLIIMCLTVLCGCSQKYQQAGILKPYYNSVVTNSKSVENTLPVSLRIRTIDFNPPEKKTDWAIFTVKMIPIVSLIPMSPDLSSTNMLLRKPSKRIPGEVEKTLTSELQRTMLFHEVSFEGPPKDYDIKGHVDFKWDNYSTFGGLGIFGLGLIPPLVLVPGAFVTYTTEHYICEARFEVVDSQTNKTVFTKNYYADKKIKLTALVTSAKRKGLNTVPGKKLFPPIVKEFINDLDVYLRQDIEKKLQAKR